MRQDYRGTTLLQLGEKTTRNQADRELLRRVANSLDQLVNGRNSGALNRLEIAFDLGEQVAGVARFFATDHLGSVTEATNSSSALLARYVFDPSGRRTLVAGTDVTSAGFAGQQWHADTNLSLTKYRAYDPTIGRWTSEDPLGLHDGPNVYAYVRNAPLVSIDPVGLAGQVCCRPLKVTGMKWVNHCYIRDDDGTTFGLHVVGMRGNKQRNNPTDVGGQCKTCTPHCENGDLKKCIENADSNYPQDSNYGIIGPNSNTYAATMARACCKEGMPDGLGPHPGSNSPKPPDQYRPPKQM